MAKVKKKGKNKALGFLDGDMKYVAYFFVIIIFFGLIYFVSQGTDDVMVDESIESTLSKEIETDELSKAAFDYLNNFRVSTGVDYLDYSYEMYIIALDMSNKKSAVKSLFIQAPERTDFVENYPETTLAKFDASMPIIHSQYTYIYDIEENGIRGFMEEFDRVYFVKNIIKDAEKFNHGAIGCSSQYCTLIMYNDDAAIDTPDYG